MGREDVEKMIETIGAELSAFRGQMALTEARITPRFNILNYFWVDENKISEIIADLLNPGGDHSQGSLFLSEFINKFWPKDLPAPDTREARVKTNEMTREGRFPDIKVSFGNSGSALVIESKITGAPDQPSQIKDYLNDLKYQAGGHSAYHLIYLTRYGSSPTCLSMGVEEKKLQGALMEWGTHLSSISAEDVIIWLRSCVGACQSHRVRAFVEEFIFYIQSEVLKELDMSEKGLIVDAIGKSPRSIITALEIASVDYELRKRNYETFLEALKAHVFNEADQWLPAGWVFYEMLDHKSSVTYDISSIEDRKKSIYSINIGPSRAGKYSVRLEFYKNNFSDVAVGVASKTPHNGEMRGLRDMLDSKIAVMGDDKSVNWVWWTKFEPDIRGWWDSLRAQEMLSDGEMAEKVADNFRSIIAAVCSDECILAIFNNA